MGEAFREHCGFPEGKETASHQYGTSRNSHERIARKGHKHIVIILLLRFAPSESWYSSPLLAMELEPFESSTRAVCIVFAS